MDVSQKPMSKLIDISFIIFASCDCISLRHYNHGRDVSARRYYAFQPQFLASALFFSSNNYATTNHVSEISLISNCIRLPCFRIVSANRCKMHARKCVDLTDTGLQSEQRIGFRPDCVNWHRACDQGTHLRDDLASATFLHAFIMEREDYGQIWKSDAERCRNPA